MKRGEIYAMSYINRMQEKIRNIELTPLANNRLLRPLVAAGMVLFFTCTADAKPGHISSVIAQGLNPSIPDLGQMVPESSTKGIVAQQIGEFPNYIIARTGWPTAAESLWVDENRGRVTVSLASDETMVIDGGTFELAGVADRMGKPIKVDVTPGDQVETLQVVVRSKVVGSRFDVIVNRLYNFFGIIKNPDGQPLSEKLLQRLLGTRYRDAMQAKPNLGRTRFIGLTARPGGWSYRDIAMDRPDMEEFVPYAETLKSSGAAFLPTIQKDISSR